MCIFAQISRNGVSENQGHYRKNGRQNGREQRNGRTSNKRRIGGNGVETTPKLMTFFHPVNKQLKEIKL